MVKGEKAFIKMKRLNFYFYFDILAPLPVSQVRWNSDQTDFLEYKMVCQVSDKNRFCQK